MKRFLIYVVIGLLIIGCDTKKKNEVQSNTDYKNDETQIDSLKPETPALRFDHIFVLVDSTNTTYQKMIEAG